MIPYSVCHVFNDFDQLTEKIIPLTIKKLVIVDAFRQQDGINEFIWTVELWNNLQITKTSERSLQPHNYEIDGVH